MTHKFWPLLIVVGMVINAAHAYALGKPDCTGIATDGTLQSKELTETVSWTNAPGAIAHTVWFDDINDPEFTIHTGPVNSPLSLRAYARDTIQVTINATDGINWTQTKCPFTVAGSTTPAVLGTPSCGGLYTNGPYDNLGVLYFTANGPVQAYTVWADDITDGTQLHTGSVNSPFYWNTIKGHAYNVTVNATDGSTWKQVNCGMFVGQ